MGHLRQFCAAVVFTLAAATLAAQAPRPFPQPAAPPPGGQQPARPAPATPAQPGSKPSAGANVPNESTLGVPVYPTAQFITSYDAGGGQRFYLFGVTASYAEMVAYYRAALKQKGNELFQTPGTHQFEIGRFREETMAFPPSVTVKDYTFGGSGGYPNPKRGTQPERFATIIQIVPAPPGTPPD